MDYTTFEHSGLLLTSDLSRVGVTPRDIARAIEGGVLMRLRRGTLCRTEHWDALSERGRHLLRIDGVRALARRPVVLARESAAAVLGIPLEEFPDHVVVLDQWRGGGRSEPGVVRTARGATSARLITHRGYTCVSFERTVLDVVRGRPFATAVAILDWALSPRSTVSTTKQGLREEAKRMSCPPSTLRALEFSTPLSGSIGESEARAVMYQLGFARPVLQKKFSDAEGDMYPDFIWEGVNAAAEFDGKLKYTREEYTKGDPAEVVWREKKREDRLRRQVRTVIRILTVDVKNPRLLEAKLLDAGVPRRRGA